MKKLTAGDPETMSPDLLAANLERLKELFPELVTEGPDGAAVNVDVLKALVGDNTVTDADERFGLNWHGKRQARQLALTPSTGTLRPCPEESMDWDTTQNLIIEGENLEVLKLLQKSYAGRVKLIYIDPPYNTGNDFVYPDKFSDSIGNYLAITGQVDGEGRRLNSNTESSGRYHTDWLNMIYPRLKLARELLRKDGVIFVSIDDHEVHALRSTMNEIFGEENCVATIAWQKKDTPSNDAKSISVTHEYLLAYARSDDFSRRLLPRSEDQLANYRNPDNDPRGPWIRSTLIRREERDERRYEVINPQGRTKVPPPGTSWRVPPETYQDLVNEGRIWWGQDEDGELPFRKKFLTEVQEGVVPVTWWDYQFAGSNRNAKMEIRQTFDGDVPFDTPKPSSLIRRILDVTSESQVGDLILDFFAGSGTTAHGILTQNLHDSGNRRFILVQLPEPTSHPQYKTIADISKERVRRVGKKICDENPLFVGDLGFRVLKLDSSNIRAWEPDPHNLDQTILDYTENIKEDRTEQDILYELLLKLGLDLCVPIEQKELAGKVVHSIGGGVLMACLAPAITFAEVEPLALGLVEWHQLLAPAGDTTCVFRDSAFSDDVAKTNLSAILNQNGLSNVRSL
jgi:adenine-specific DNA-methyltransferase